MKFQKSFVAHLDVATRELHHGGPFRLAEAPPAELPLIDRVCTLENTDVEYALTG